jgi:plastocyanin
MAKILHQWAVLKNALRVAPPGADTKRMRILGLAGGVLASLLAHTAVAGTIQGSVALAPADLSFRGGAKPNAYVGQVSGWAGHPGSVVASDSTYGVAYVVGPITPEETPNESVLLDQKGHRFVPRILAVVVGQSVEFRNSDNVFHNVFSYSPPKRFDLGRYPRGKSKRLSFPKPGLVQIFCDIHSDMRADLVVVPSRRYAYVDGRGRFTIGGVPAGRYTVAVWLPRSGERTMVVDVPASGAGRLTMTAP